MARRVVRRSTKERDAVRALEDALDPIEQAHADGKEAVWAAQDAYQEAVKASPDPDDPARVAAWNELQDAKTAKVEAGIRLEETRTWLRREAAIVNLQTTVIPELSRRLALPILVRDGADDAVDDREYRAELEAQLIAARQELQRTVDEVTPTRRALAELGAVAVGEPVPPDLPPGSADVTAPTVKVSTTVNRRKEGK